MFTEYQTIFRHPLTDAPRDKCAHFREINGIAAAFQYSQKNYIPTALSFL
ncbi:glucosamine-6-phosphate deaminase [Mixta tenebrionis]|uniref:Glucosamine-6-phosphate deaminase n=1 Tax=Mixta tenebrionis TaxID=2562439 RepID=A0A506UWE0_9GAMM|nr:glucosamine-6-phosphate deaminase [Mixta tenebrionis]